MGLEGTREGYRCCKARSERYARKDGQQVSPSSVSQVQRLEQRKNTYAFDVSYVRDVVYRRMPSSSSCEHADSSLVGSNIFAF